MTTRRTFLQAVAGGALLAASSSRAEDEAKKELTVQDAIDRILAATEVSPIQDTVDTVKAGDPKQPLTGIATTFLATREVIEKAAQQRANLLITHEPTFYNHLDKTDALTDDPVYRGKRELLQKTGIVVWRFHDYWHRTKPDGIETGVLKRLGWEKNVDPADPYLCVLPATPLSRLLADVKHKLDVKTAQVIGDPRLSCRRVALQPGAWGGDQQIQMLGRPDVDVLVCGEINEWETSEYVRDAIHAGQKKALVILGHVQSEEPGMEHLVEWLRPRFPGVTITHVPARSPFWTA